MELLLGKSQVVGLERTPETEAMWKKEIPVLFLHPLRVSTDLPWYPIYKSVSRLSTTCK